MKGIKFIMEPRVVFFRNLFEDKLLEAVSLCGRIHQDMRTHHEEMILDNLPHPLLLARLKHVIEKAVHYTVAWTAANLQAEKEIVNSAANTLQCYGTLLSIKSASHPDFNTNPQVKDLARAGANLLDAAMTLRTWINR